MSTFKQDPEKYAEMAQPFESEADAGAAIGAFLEKVEQLRESYRIAEIVMCVAVYLPPNDDYLVRGVETTRTWGNLVRHFELADKAAISLGRDLARAVTGKSATESEEFALTPEPMEDDKPE